MKIIIPLALLLVFSFKMIEPIFEWENNYLLEEGSEAELTEIINLPNGNFAVIAHASKRKAKTPFLLIIDGESGTQLKNCLLYTSPSPRDRQKSRMPSSA